MLPALPAMGDTLLAIVKQDGSTHLGDAHSVGHDTGDGTGQLEGSNGTRDPRSCETRHPQYQ